MNKEKLIDILIFLTYKSVSVLMVFASIGGIGLAVEKISSYGWFIIFAVIPLLFMSIAFWFFADTFVLKSK
jgi:hypothetical protein